jgi:para-nitrobenzyl esterase
VTPAPISPIATTDSGKVRGGIEDGIFVFKGIPYGADTAARRFKPALNPDPWPGIRDCLEFGPRSPQPPETDIYGPSHDSTASEDCLVLNVWTPGLRDDGARPVMVWLHGGGFFSFSGSTAFSDGVRLATRGNVVAVTLNHRLGALGFMHLDEILGPAYADSGNAGLSDLVLALRWVRDNIREFGGDPGNVTIFGESGGGAKVSALMAVPAAKGLFHRAIVQSGSALRLRERAAANKVTKAYLDDLGVPASRAIELTKMPLDRLIAPSLKLPFPRLMNLSPVVGGPLLPRHPFDPNAPDVSADVPMLIGSCHDESTLMYGLRDASLFDLSWRDLPERLSSWIPDTDPGPIIAAYRRDDPDLTASDIFFAATCDFGILRNAITQAERKYAQRTALVFMYEFDFEASRHGKAFKATHADELAYIFDTLANSMPDQGPEMRGLVDQLSESWIAFARTGDPNNGYVPYWPAYDPSTRSTMAFDRVSQVVGDPRGIQRALFPKVSAVVGPFEYLQGVMPD